VKDSAEQMMTGKGESERGGGSGKVEVNGRGKDGQKRGNWA